MAQAAGRVVLHGLAVSLRGPLGLFDVPLYFPNALAVKVLPRTVAVRASTLGVMTGLPLDRPGRHRMRRRGGGTELHELRELQPGDPFKSIAWKASAKAGQLLVREVDHEVQQTLLLVLDVSGSMRGGEPGERKLDFALELCVAHARAWLDRGDRVGLITVDGRVLGQRAAGRRAGAPDPHLRRAARRDRGGRRRSDRARRHEVVEPGRALRAPARRRSTSRTARAAST